MKSTSRFLFGSFALSSGIALSVLALCLDSTHANPVVFALSVYVCAATVFLAFKSYSLPVSGGHRSGSSCPAC